MREQTLKEIVAQFDESAKKYCEKSSGAFFEISNEYNGAESLENLKYRFAKIYYNSYILEFKFTVHGTLGVTNHILECNIYFDKTKQVSVPLYFIVDYCDVNTLSPLYIPYISNREGVIQAFDCISGVLAKVTEGVIEISLNEEKRQSIFNSFIKELLFILDINIPDEEAEENDEFFEIDDRFYTYLTCRFVGTPFMRIIKGDYAKAAKNLNKLKRKTGYEKRVLDMLQNEETVEIPDLSAIKKIAKNYSANGAEKPNFKEFGTLFVSWIILSVAFLIPYALIYFLLMFIEGLGSFYLMGPLYSSYVCVLAAFITAIAFSYFTRLKFYKLFFKKDFEQYCEIDSMQNGKGSNKVMKVFLAIVISLSVIASCMLVRWNVNFKEDYFIDNSKFFSISGKEYSYSDINRIYYKPDRKNDLGETLDFPSYVMELKNGEEIDFYDFDEIERYQEKLFDFLEQKGVKVERNS